MREANALFIYLGEGNALFLKGTFVSDCLAELHARRSLGLEGQRSAAVALNKNWYCQRNATL